MFAISMLPAGHGDSLLLEYGARPDSHFILIDGGPAHTGPDLRAALAAIDRLELVVVTHVDADHIGGIIDLLVHSPDRPEIGEIWFNGYRHLPSDELGPAQGEILSALIAERGLSWNRAFDAGAVVVPDRGDLPRVTVNGGLELTLLSPTNDELRRLRPKWAEETENAGIAAGDADEALRLLRQRLGHRFPADLLGDEGPPDVDRDADETFVEDTSEANGSSIVLLAKYDQSCVLLCADAYPSLVRRGLERLSSGPIELSAFKVSHHGSKKNTDCALIDGVRCSRYLISTNGSYYNHPDNAGIARVIASGQPDPVIFFNYRSAKNEAWSDRRLQDASRFRAKYPQSDRSGLEVPLHDEQPT